MGNGPLPLEAEPEPWMNRPFSLSLTLPPLASLVFLYEGE
jgi:1,4-alpha-glucan branching enzyme